MNRNRKLESQIKRDEGRMREMSKDSIGKRRNRETEMNKTGIKRKSVKESDKQK